MGEALFCQEFPGVKKTKNSRVGVGVWWVLFFSGIAYYWSLKLQFFCKNVGKTKKGMKIVFDCMFLSCQGEFTLYICLNVKELLA